MAEITIPDELYRRLSEQAKSMNRSVEEYIEPTLRRLADYVELLTEWKPLTDEEWEREWEAWDRDAEELGRRLPPGFQVDDSREAMYFGSDEAELDSR